MIDHIKAHRYCTDNRKLIENSSICGCFYCIEIFSASEVKEYLNEGAGTAFCPKWRIDSVIPDQSGFAITKSFLEEMHDKWFEKTYSRAPEVYLLKLDGISGRLATMAKPVSEVMGEELAALSGIGFKTLVSALTDSEVRELSLANLSTLLMGIATYLH